jgi:hypothetical protein
MAERASAIPYIKQSDPQNRGCGAACLSMVYQSFGKEVRQSSIWPLTSKPNRFGVMSSTTHLLVLHAISQGFNAVAIQARDPLQALRICRENGIRAILNHRLEPSSETGHYSVLVDIGDDGVVLHDPLSGPFRRLSYAELTQLWLPSSPNSEVVGNTLIGISDAPPTAFRCEFCLTSAPEKIVCPRCHKPVGLQPMALLGCSRDGCIARMWNYICCPFCDCLFNEAGKSAAVLAGAQEPKSTLPEPPNLDSVIAEIDKYCAHILSIPGLAQNPDLKIQMAVLQANKDKLKAAQAEEMVAVKAQADRLGSLNEQSRQKTEEHRKKVDQLNTPLDPLDGNALGQALLKNLGFK